MSPSLSRLLVLLLACTFTLPPLHAARPSRRTQLPNVLLIVADGLEPTDLDSANPRRATTPHLDQLAREGLRFSQAYAGAPVAAAARASLVTGQHSGRSRVRSSIQEPLAPADITLAEVLRSVGYRSGIVGQWGLGWEGTTGVPTDQGFNEFLGTLDLVHGSDDRTAFLWRNPEPFGKPVPFEFSNASRGRRTNSAAAWLQRGATNFVRINEDAAFLLLFAPHLPGAQPQAALPGDPLNARYTNATWTAAERIRAARMERLDLQVGALLEDLRLRKLTNDTLVLLTSVPGHEPDASTATNRMVKQGPWRDEAGGLYEGNLRVPLIAWWPGHIAPGTTNLPVAAWDLLPTVAEVAGAPVPATANGRSVAGAWTGKECREFEFYWERHGSNSAQAGRIGPWKAILRGAGQPMELYNLAEDPGETTNQAERNPERVAQFQALFAKQFRPWSPPTDGAATAAGRPGSPAPTNRFQGAVKTNFIPVKR